MADSESAEALAVLSQDTAAQDARQQAERAQRVVAVEAVFKERRFGALWLLASAVAKSERRYLSGRPSKAAIAASRAAGYMEGLRDAACALAGVESGELLLEHVEPYRPLSAAARAKILSTMVTLFPRPGEPAPDPTARWSDRARRVLHDTLGRFRHRYDRAPRGEPRPGDSVVVLDRPDVVIGGLRPRPGDRSPVNFHPSSGELAPSWWPGDLPERAKPRPVSLPGAAWPDGGESPDVPPRAGPGRPGPGAVGPRAGDGLAGARGGRARVTEHPPGPEDRPPALVLEFPRPPRLSLIVGTVRDMRVAEPGHPRPDDDPPRPAA